MRSFFLLMGAVSGLAAGLIAALALGESQTLSNTVGLALTGAISTAFLCEYGRLLHGRSVAKRRTNRSPRRRVVRHPTDVPFERRLEDYAGHCVSRSDSDQGDRTPMRLWFLDSVGHRQGTPPKSPRLVRVLLLRIKAAVARRGRAGSGTA